MRKLLSIVAALAIVLSCCIMGIGTAASAAEEAPEADFMAFDGVLEEYIGAGGDVVIPASLGIVEIAANAFYNNKDVTSVIIPEGVEIIGNRAFENCENIEKIELPYSLLEIGGNAFASCLSLTEITIPGRLEIIPNWAFADCGGLKKIVFSYGVREIHHQAFCSLRGTNIKKVILPETVEIIASGAFNNQLDTVAIEYVICNPNCEIGLHNDTYKGNIDHEWATDEIRTPFQSAYGVVTYKVVVPKDSNVAEFLKTNEKKLFEYDTTNHVDKLRVLEEKEEYFEKLAENQEDYGIQEPRTSATTDNPSDPGTQGNDTQGNDTQGNGNNVNNNASNGAAADSGLVTTIIIAVVAVVIVIIICVMVVVILFATGKLGGKKKKPLTEEEMRAKILAEMEEKKAAEEAPAQEAPAEDAE